MNRIRCNIAGMLNPKGLVQFGSRGSSIPEVLYIEDNPHDRRFLMKACEAHQIAPKFIIVEDGEKALFLLKSMAKHISPAPDLIILDLNMPKRTGQEVLSFIKGQNSLKEIPVIVFTSSMDPREKESCEALGANFIQKPISGDYGVICEVIMKSLIHFSKSYCAAGNEK